MPATLTPIVCTCGLTVCYEIRAGKKHQNVETYDPYAVAGVLKKEPGGWVIGPLAGEFYQRFVADMRRSLRPIGVQRTRWERAKKRGLKDVTAIVEKGVAK